MKDQDKLRAYLKELPREEPSANFTLMVMERVKQERVKSPVIYQPIISRHLWGKLFIGMVMLFVGAIVFRTYFPGNEQAGLLKPLTQIDYSIFWKPLQTVSATVAKIPLTYLTALGAVSVLLLIDLFYNRIESRRA